MQGRLVALLLVAACGSASEVPDGGEETSDVFPPEQVRHGAHGSVIDIVATTANGTAAVTQDATNNTRLWPVLDGSEEPIVVRASPAAELGLLHGDGFSIATVDEAGDLELVAVTTNGVQRSRRQILRDGSVLGIATTSRWLLALRNDQTIAIFDAKGELHGRVALPSGRRGVGLVARNDRVDVIVQTEAITHAIPVEPTALSLGEESHPFAIAGHSFALSPNGKSLAIMRGGDEVRVVDLSIGGEGKPACDRVERPPVALAPASQVPVGFLDDDTVSCLSFGMIKWFPVGSNQSIYAYASPQPELVAYGGDVQVSGHGLSIGIAHKKTKMQYLGYRMTDPTMLRSTPQGLAVGRSGSPPLVLDHELRVQARIGIDASAYEDVYAIDERYALRTIAEPDAHRIEMVDTTTEETTQIARSDDYHVRFEPTTNLLAIQPGSVAHYDATKHAFEAREKLPVQGKVWLVDPDLSDGTVAFVVSVYVGHLKITPIDRHLHAGKAIEADGNVTHIDRAGRIYIATGQAIHVYRGNTLLTKLPIGGNPVVTTDPKAERILVLGDDKVSAFDLDGKQRWSIAQQSAIDVIWDHGPVVRYASGLARLDARTGRLRERACGWVFELRASPPELTGATESVCDAE
ncbi:MAG: hypothetical protein QM831_29755 [Kofleriaceae bacterium]